MLHLVGQLLIMNTKYRQVSKNISSQMPRVNKEFVGFASQADCQDKIILKSTLNYFATCKQTANKKFQFMPVVLDFHKQKLQL